MARQTKGAVAKDVGRRVAEIRAERGLTQERLAEALNVSPKYVQRIEAGRENLTIESLVRIANHLRVKVGALFERPATRVVRPGRPPTRAPRL